MCRAVWIHCPDQVRFISNVTRLSVQPITPVIAHHAPQNNPRRLCCCFELFAYILFGGSFVFAVLVVWSSQSDWRKQAILSRERSESSD
jgi:hypothetical protein